ncbi:MAG: LytR C-terminal domain-containing protein [Bacteroidota bacterium]|jgi:hypothetical protein
MSTSPQESSSNNLYLHAAIGFLSLLLLLLLLAVVTRVIFPRIQNERAESNAQLISDIIQLEVLNGCGVPGIANAYTSVLRKNGFDVVETGNFDHFDVPNTMVISRSGVMANARRVADALGVDQVHVIREESPDFFLDVTVVIGNDYETLNTD